MRQFSIGMNLSPKTCSNAVFIALLILTSSLLPGQNNPSFRFTHLTLEDGLGDNWCHDALMDKYGFMWFATQDGLSRYDGHSFANFRNAETDSLSIGGNIIMEIIEDNQFGLWVASNGGGLNFYNPETETFSTYLNQPRNTNSLSANTVVSLYQDKNNILWVGTFDAGFNRFDPKTEQIKRFALTEGKIIREEAFYKNSVYDIHPDPHNENIIWLAANNGLYRFDTEKEILSFHGGPKIEDFYLRCAKIIDGENQDFWIASPGAGICHFDPSNYTWEIYPPQPKYWKEGNEHANHILDLTQKSPSELWFIDRNLGLGIFDIKEKKFAFNEFDPTNKYSIISNEGFSLYKDPLNRLWVLSFRKGVSFLDPAYQMFQYQHLSSQLCPRMIFNETTDFVRDPKSGHLYLTTHGCDGLYIYDKNQQLLDWAPCSLHPDDLQVFTDVLLDSKGRVWTLAANAWKDASLLYYNPQTGYSEPYQHPQLERVPIHEFRLTDIEEDKHGNLWVATNFEGLIKIEPRKDTIIQYLASTTFPQYLNPTVEINEILVGSNGLIWMATVSDGVFSFDPGTEKFTQYGKGKEIWPDLKIQSLAEDKLGRIWVGTNSTGIKLIDPKQPEIVESLTRNQGLPAEQITKIRADHKGNMWLATLKGLSQYSLEDQSFISYGKKEGLEDIFLVNKGLEITKDGQLFLGQNKGFYTFNVDSISRNRTPAPVKLTYFKVFEKEKTFNKNLNFIKQVNLGYRENFLNIGFSCLNYSAPEKNIYAYKLEGLDQNWVYPQAGQRFASYTDLNPGYYTFRVKAANNDGVWNHDEPELKIYIKPPFWRTNWFFILCSAIVTGALYFFYQWRIRVNYEKAQIEKQLVELELKALKSQMNPHFIFNSLNAIKMLVQLDKKNEAGDYLAQFSKMIRGLLEYSDRKIITLSDELEISKLFLSMESLRFQSKFNYQITVEEALNVDLINVPALIFQPYLENAIWHGLMHLEKDGKLELRIEKNDGHVQCIIEDNGIGREMARKLRDKRLKDHKSRGMAITKERLRLTQKLNKTAMGVEIVDKRNPKGEALGTKVIIQLN